MASSNDVFSTEVNHSHHTDDTSSEHSNEKYYAVGDIGIRTLVIIMCFMAIFALVVLTYSMWKRKMLFEKYGIEKDFAYNPRASRHSSSSSSSSPKDNSLRKHQQRLFVSFDFDQQTDNHVSTLREAALMMEAGMLKQKQKNNNQEGAQHHQEQKQQQLQRFFVDFDFDQPRVSSSLRDVMLTTRTRKHPSMRSLSVSVHGEESISTVDYDYFKVYVSDASVSSAGGTMGDGTARGSLLSQYQDSSFYERSTCLVPINGGTTTSSLTGADGESRRRNSF